tara:strand:+ start:30 stop:1247 length:1218 start_codon:yes stop_codon:yes gene_type:complete
MSTLNVDKVDPSSGTALEIGTSGDTITVPSGATFVVAGTTEITGTNNVQRPNVQPLWMNGDFAVSQRATSAASLTASGFHTVDRYRMGYTDAGTWTQTQESLTTGDAYTDGFSNSIKMDCTTAKGSLAVNTELWIEERFEGQDLQLLKKGTANAEKLTIGFWVKATKTGTYILSIYDNDNTRQCSQSYTVSSGDTWEYKVVNFPADTTGVLGNDNAASFRIFFFIAMGTNYTSGTLATTWAAFANANQAVGQVNGADSTSNNFEITGVQMEVGEYTSTTIPPFQHESYGNNLARCQRYYYLHAEALNFFICLNSYYTSTDIQGAMFFKQSMRAPPTGDMTSGTGYFIIHSDSAGDAINDLTAEKITVNGCSLTADSADGVSGTAGNAGRIKTNDAAAVVAFSAEL